MDSGLKVPVDILAASSSVFAGVYYVTRQLGAVTDFVLKDSLDTILVTRCAASGGYATLLV